MSVRQLLGNFSLTFLTGHRTQIVTAEQSATRRPFRRRSVRRSHLMTPSRYIVLRHKSRGAFLCDPGERAETPRWASARWPANGKRTRPLLQDRGPLNCGLSVSCATSPSTRAGAMDSSPSPRMGQASGADGGGDQAPDLPSSAAAKSVLSARPPYVVATYRTVKKELSCTL